MANPNNPSSSSPPAPVGLDPKVGGLLAYLFVFVSGIILYLISQDKYIRFHALQSTIFFIAVNLLLLIVSFIPFVIFLAPIIYLAEFIIWIVLMVKAYQGEKFKLPIIGDIALKRA